MEKYFITLDPEEKLKKLIENQKQVIKETVGNQKYLADIPHSTLFLLTLDSQNQESIILEQLKKLASQLPIQSIKLTGLNVFKKDSQTDCHTLTYNFSKENIENLKLIQLQVVNAVEFINTKQFFSKDNPIWKKSSEIELKNLKKYGFPFIGNIWKPHLTLASIDLDKFDQVYRKIKLNQIQGQFSLNTLSLYRIAKPHVLVKRFELKENV